MKCDILIIGCGIAGASAALELAKQNLDVIVISADETLIRSNSALAQGGIVFSGDGDSQKLLSKDIQEAGAGLCNEEAVEQLVRLGPDLVRSFLIDEAKVPFDRTKEGDLSLTEEGAHSIPRIIHHKDQTGKAIMQS